MDVKKLVASIRKSKMLQQKFNWQALSKKEKKNFVFEFIKKQMIIYGQVLNFDFEMPVLKEKGSGERASCSLPVDINKNVTTDDIWIEFSDMFWNGGSFNDVIECVHHEAFHHMLSQLALASRDRGSLDKNQSFFLAMLN